MPRTTGASPNNDQVVPGFSSWSNWTKIQLKDLDHCIDGRVFEQNFMVQLQSPALPNRSKTDFGATRVAGFQSLTIDFKAVTTLLGTFGAQRYRGNK